MGTYSHVIKPLKVGDKQYKFYDLTALADPRYDDLPISIRYMLESAVRHCDEFHVRRTDVEAILDWQRQSRLPADKASEIPFQPARVLLQDFTGVPAIVDLASMRDAVKELGADPGAINPICPVDLVVDHSVQVDSFGNLESLAKNQAMEFERNRERFNFLKWGSRAFKNLLIVPPGSGIVHQVNLEYLARVVFVDEQSGVLFPDSVVGTDSHTTMIDGLGVLGWGVGGIEAEAVMLGQPVSMLLPEVVGYELVGRLPPTATSTDLVLTVTKNLRQKGVVGKFVEFFGEGVAHLSIADRATIANMCPEYGATVGFFPVDSRTLDYLRQTGRDKHCLERIEAYLKANKMFVNYAAVTSGYRPKFSEVLKLDLASVTPCVSGPKRPQDQIPLRELHEQFQCGLTEPVSFKGQARGGRQIKLKTQESMRQFRFGLKPEQAEKRVSVVVNGTKCELRHGSVVISAITSCTNTSNPSVMLAAGLVAKKAVALGLKVPAFVKTSLSPGSGVVTKYLEASGLLPELEALGYYIVGYGCMTCIGNSGPLDEPVAKAIDDNDLVVAGVLSGNRNFEGRIHSQARANYLASPPLVVVYGLAGRVDIDLEREPVGTGRDGRQVYLRDIWPTHEEVATLEERYVKPQFFTEVYKGIQTGSREWQELSCPSSQLYPWDANSTYIKKVPFFDGMTSKPPAQSDVVNAYALLNLGDSVTTDHISPAGNIARTSPAARYLQSRGITDSKLFNSYGARRGHDEVMARGTFANIRLMNKLASKVGPRTLHVPSGQEMDVFDAALHYRHDAQPVVVLAGKEYGSGSSRDWAAKGPALLGVRAVVAESFERIHRSNLIGMGIVPMEFTKGENAESLGLTGREQFTIHLPADLKPGATLTVQTTKGDGSHGHFKALCRFDTEVELEYWRNGGILQYMIRKLIQK